MVASTNVRTTGDRVLSQSPRARLRTVRVGNTASQIISASWCFVGGPGRPVGGGGAVVRGWLVMEQGWVRAADGPTNVAVSGKPGSDERVEDTSAAAIAVALDQVGSRLKRIRAQRRMTLTGVAEATGISKSTLSRLETGGRRPTLELLLALSHTYRVPLDDLVAAPEEGDPRLRLKPGRVKGRTVIPLTRQPGGMQAWKIIIPTSKSTPEARAHDGYEWIYVLSSHMRFVLGDQDSVLG